MTLKTTPLADKPATFQSTRQAAFSLAGSFADRFWLGGVRHIERTRAQDRI